MRLLFLRGCSRVSLFSRVRSGELFFDAMWFIVKSKEKEMPPRISL